MAGILPRRHFDIYHQAPQPQIDAAALEAERAYARISASMDHELTARMPVILVANDADLPRTAEQAYRLVAASGAPIEAEHLLLSEETLAQRPYWMAHELTHPFLFEFSLHQWISPRGCRSRSPIITAARGNPSHWPRCAIRSQLAVFQQSRAWLFQIVIGDTPYSTTSPRSTVPTVSGGTSRF